MFKFVTNRGDLYSELYDIIRLFYPVPENEELSVNHCYVKSGSIKNFIEINGNCFVYQDDLIIAENELLYARLDARVNKHALYKAFKGYLKRSLPWGSLTGIRPTKLAYQMMESGLNVSDVAIQLTETFNVSPEKSALIEKIIVNQTDFVKERMALSCDFNFLPINDLISSASLAEISSNSTTMQRSVLAEISSNPATMQRSVLAEISSNPATMQPSVVAEISSNSKTIQPLVVAEISSSSKTIQPSENQLANLKHLTLDYAQKLVNLYVHIPFCVTRCNYCSFVSTTIDKQKWLVSPYVEALIKEINLTKEIIYKSGLKVFSVYIGGGTPTSLDAEQLKRVLAAASCDKVEFTCEAGRPDTITEEKLLVMAECGVNRISVNPQSLSDKTLKLIGRNHTAEQFYSAYEAAKKFGFRKNVDLIAGLSQEKLEDFQTTLKGILSLKPENITVHTLSKKRGAEIVNDSCDADCDIESMVDYSIKQLFKSGYEPYYLYRQKQMLGNLENIGWSLAGSQCVNNITTMEESLSVYACGAGAISKRLFYGGRIERLANPKDVLLYLQQFDERMNKKEIFYKN